MQKSNEVVDTTEPVDLVEQTVAHAHVVIPIVGAVLIFLMAFIAILFGAPNGTWSS